MVALFLALTPADLVALEKETIRRRRSTEDVDCVVVVNDAGAGTVAEVVDREHYGGGGWTKKLFRPYIDG